MRFSVCFSLLIAMTASAAAAPPDAAAAPAIARQGVSREQATAIAQKYFLSNVGCGHFSGVRDLGDSWEIEGKIGYGGTPITGFLIDKATGALTLDGMRVQ